MESLYKLNRRELFLNFFKKIDGLSNNEYGYLFIAYMIAPVITGIKPSSTITLNNTGKKLSDYWKENGHELLDYYGLKSRILIEKDEKMLVLVYDEDNLIKHLCLGKNHEMLKKFGYDEEFELNTYLNCLKQRAKYGDFPHESGIFLGIPSEDVKGFLRQDKCVFTGQWKVYTNEYRHRDIFIFHDVSRDMYMRNYLYMRKVNLKNIYSKNREELYKYCG